MNLTTTLLISSVIQFFIFMNICRIRIRLIEAIVVMLTTFIGYGIAYYFFSDVGYIASLAGNLIVIIIFSMMAYRKIKILPISILYGTLAIIIVLLGGNLSSAVLGFILLPMFGVVGREIVLSYMLLSLVYVGIAFCFSFLISRITGNFLQRQMLTFDDSLIKRFANFILIGAMIILALFFINVFLHEVLVNYAILTLVNAISLSIFFCFLVFTVFTFTGSVRKESEIHYKNEMLQSLQSYNVTVEDMATEMRRFRHDHMNMLLGFHEYIESNDIENIHNYFKQYMTVFSEATIVMESQIDELKNIKRPEIKSILSAKVLYAQQLGINVNIEVPDEIEFTDVSSLLDFCRITGIFLDNAVDACRGLDNAALRFMAIKRGSEILFVFANTCNIPPDMARLGDRGYTTKEGQRGLGLYTARQLIEKNSNLALSTLVQDGMFVQELSVLQ